MIKHRDGHYITNSGHQFSSLDALVKYFKTAPSADGLPVKLSHASRAFDNDILLSQPPPTTVSTEEETYDSLLPSQPPPRLDSGASHEATGMRARTGSTVSYRRTSSGMSADVSPLLKKKRAPPRPDGPPLAASPAPTEGGELYGSMLQASSPPPPPVEEEEYGSLLQAPVALPAKKEAWSAPSGAPVQEEEYGSLLQAPVAVAPSPAAAVEEEEYGSLLQAPVAVAPQDTYDTPTSATANMTNPVSPSFDDSTYESTAYQFGSPVASGEAFGFGFGASGFPEEEEPLPPLPGAAPLVVEEEEEVYEYHNAALRK